MDSTSCQSSIQVPTKVDGRKALEDIYGAKRGAVATSHWGDDCQDTVYQMSNPMVTVAVYTRSGRFYRPKMEERDCKDQTSGPR